jgi:hypothetical protein
MRTIDLCADLICYVCEREVKITYQFRKGFTRLNVCPECFALETKIERGRQVADAIGKCYVCLYKLSEEQLSEPHIRLGIVRNKSEPKTTVIICDRCYAQQIGVPLTRPFSKEEDADEYVNLI